MTKSSPSTPSVSRLAGQLDYMFEDDPSLRDAPVEQLAARLNLEDRLARAIARYPLDTDAQIQSHLSEFEERISTHDVRAARQLALSRYDD
jgi:hypothetical protein